MRARPYSLTGLGRALAARHYPDARAAAREFLRARPWLRWEREEVESAAGLACCDAVARYDPRKWRGGPMAKWVYHATEWHLRDVFRDRRRLRTLGRFRQWPGAYNPGLCDRAVGSVHFRGNRS